MVNASQIKKYSRCRSDGINKPAANLRRTFTFLKSKRVDEYCQGVAEKEADTLYCHTWGSNHKAACSFV